MLHRNTIGEVNSYAGFLLFEISEIVAETNALRRQCRNQRVQQIRAACAQGGYVEMAQPDIHQDRACPGANEEMLVRSAQCRHSFEQTQFLQDARGVGPEHHARAHLAQFVRPLVDRCVNACAMKRDGRGYAADSAADDADIQSVQVH